jgi:hypothetical protein
MSIQDGLESLWNNLTGQTAANAAAAEQAAQAQKIAQMQQAAGVYGDYRQQQQQARMNALSNISTAYQPANNALATLYGGGTGQAPFAARPQGYKPITAGGAAGQSAYRPQPIAPALLQPGAISSAPDPRNPPGSTLPVMRPGDMPTISPAAAQPARPTAMPRQTSPAALTSAAGPSGNERLPSGGAQAVMAAALGGRSGSARTLAGPAPQINASAIQGAGQAARAPAQAQPVAARPVAPQPLPQSQVPQLPGMGGAPSGSMGSVTGSGAMGLQPGAQVSGASPTARPSPGRISSPRVRRPSARPA